MKMNKDYVRPELEMLAVQVEQSIMTVSGFDLENGFEDLKNNDWN